MGKTKGLLCFAVCMALASASPVFAAEEKKAFSDEGELSYVQTSGNTEVTTLAAKNQAKYRFTESILGTWKAGALYSKTSGTTTAENYFTDLKLDYQNTARLYSFVNAGWMRDRFTGVDERLYGGLGEGCKFLDGPHNFLVGEVSLLYVSDRYVNDTRKSYLSGRAFAKYTYAFTEKDKFSQSVEYLHNFEDAKNYVVNSETAVIASLTSIFSLKSAYVVKYVNEPVPDTLKKTDSMLTVALVVNY